MVLQGGRGIEEVFAHSLIEIAFSKALSVGYKDVIIFSLALGVKLTHYNFLGRGASSLQSSLGKSSLPRAAN